MRCLNHEDVVGVDGGSSLPLRCRNITVLENALFYGKSGNSGEKSLGTHSPLRTSISYLRYNRG